MDIEGIRKLFPVDVSVAIASSETYRGTLFPEERALIATASLRRREQFTAGRVASRAALEHLGMRAGAIMQGSHREPLWPNGFVGSITHCDGFCCSVVARVSQVHSIGFDAEGSRPLEDPVARAVCRPEEFTHFARLPCLAETNWAKLAFSAKEAFYKCQHPLTGATLDFLDVSIRFTVDEGGAAGAFTVEVVRPGRGRILPRPAIIGAWAAERALVYTAVTQ